MFEKEFVVTKIDVDRMTNGKKVALQIRKSEKGGPPWIAFLDGEGQVLSFCPRCAAREFGNERVGSSAAN